MKKESIEELQRLEKFIESIPLNVYREKYKNIKTVEMDMPKNVQALSTFYQVYWNEKNFLNFEDFFQKYKQINDKAIYDFKDKHCFFIMEEWFWKGLEARIYRTWASLITQIHLTFLLSTFSIVGGVDASTILDHKGRDIQVSINNKEYGLQLKKVTKRSDSGIRAKVETAKRQEINISYFVPSEHDVKEPYHKKETKGRKKGELKPQMALFQKYDSNNGYLKQLNNGFVLFVENICKQIEREILKDENGE